jgi:hypothetical protein
MVMVLDEKKTQDLDIDIDTHKGIDYPATLVINT